jgi:hypothetical protein
VPCASTCAASGGAYSETAKEGVIMKMKEKEGMHASTNDGRYSYLHRPTTKVRPRTCVLPWLHRGRQRQKGFIEVESVCVHLEND